MRVAIFVFGLFLAAGPSFAAQRDVPFELIDNRVFIPVTVNGHGPLQFIADTGAPDFSLSNETMAKLGVRPEGTRQERGAGEHTDTASKIHLATISIADAHWTNVEAMALPFRAMNDAIGFTGVDGVAGTPFFERFVADFDFSRSRVRLISPEEFTLPAGAIVIPFEFYQEIYPVVKGTIDGVNGKFLVDLGDRSSLTLFSPFWHAHRMDKAFGKTIEALTGYGVGGPVRSLVARVPQFSFGGARVNDVVMRLSLQKSGVFTDAVLAGSIGTGILKRFRTIIDYRHRRFVLIANAETQRGDVYDRAGLWLGRHGTDFAILDVTAGGPAERAGLRDGDIVTAIDGTPSRQLDIFQIRRELRDASAHAPVVFDYVRGAAKGRADLLREDLLPQD